MYAHVYICGFQSVPFLTRVGSSVDFSGFNGHMSQYIPYINEVNTGLKQMHRSRVTEDMWTYLGWDEFRMKYPGLYCIFIDYVRNYR